MTDTATHDIIAGVPLFAGLSSRQLKKLISKTKETSRAAGGAVTAEGDGSLAMHVIVSGTAEVTQGGETLRELGAGDYFGEISMIDAKPRTATVTASSDLRTLALDHVDFQALVDDDSTFAKALLVNLCARLREAESR